MLLVWVVRAAAQPPIIFMYSMRPITFPRFAGAVPFLTASPETLIKVMSGFAFAIRVVSSWKASEVVKIILAPASLRFWTIWSNVMFGSSASTICVFTPGTCCSRYCAAIACASLQPLSVLGPTSTKPTTTLPPADAAAVPASVGAIVAAVVAASVGTVVAATVTASVAAGVAAVVATAVTASVAAGVAAMAATAAAASVGAGGAATIAASVPVVGAIPAAFDVASGVV